MTRVKPAEIGQMELWPPDQVVASGYGFCSTKYVRDVRPMRPELEHRVDTANCNSSFIMRLEGEGGENAVV